MRFGRTSVLACALFVAACAGAPASNRSDSGRAGARASPNIVLIVADDLGFGDLSVNGSSVIHTPNIDALAAQGVNFTNAHVTAAVCAPSRAALMTGRYQQRLGYEFNPRGRDSLGIPAHERTLPQYLADVGYRTALIGKWHLGRTPEVHPMSRFDEFFGFSGGGTGYLVRPEPGAEWMENPVEGSRAGFQPMRLERGYEEIELEGGYQTDLLTDEAVAFIERNRDGPFFMTVAYHAPHTPLQATERYLTRYRHIEDQATRIYAAMVSAMDDGVGRILDAVRRNGLAENTIVVFTSDNGCAAYIGIGACSNQPFNGYKGTYYEGGTRVPFMVAWSGRLPRGARYDELVASIDLTATLLAAANAEVEGRALDGVNLLPDLMDESSAAPRQRIYWRTTPNYAITDGDWKLLVMERADGAGMHILLFNLANDPGEQRNLAEDRPDVVERLTATFEAWSSTVPAPAFESQRRATVTAPDGVRVNLYN